MRSHHGADREQKIVRFGQADRFGKCDRKATDLSTGSMSKLREVTHVLGQDEDVIEMTVRHSRVLVDLLTVLLVVGLVSLLVSHAAFASKEDNNLPAKNEDIAVALDTTSEWILGH